MDNKEKTTLTYFGIADSHGLESFISILPFALERLGGETNTYARELMMLSMRANANRHRHAVIYRVKLTSRRAKIIQNLFDKSEFEEALIKLKKLASEVEIGKSMGMAKSWNLIPNKNLDPYG